MPAAVSPRLAEVLNKLQGVKRSSSGWSACCPGHEDRHQSLMVAEGDDGRILMFCHVGCTTEAIVAALGLSMADLFDGQPKAANPSVIREHSWAIRDGNGELIAEHVRLDRADGSKSFVWRRNGQNNLGGLKTEELPLYGIGRVIASHSDTDILIAEGEKAADALHKAGYVAVGTVTGASGLPSEGSLAPLLGFTGRVYLWPDNDEPGRQHMDRVAKRLVAMGKTPYVIDWADGPVKADAVDYLALHANGMAPLLDAAATWSPTTYTSHVSISNRRGQAPTVAKGDKKGTEKGTNSYDPEDSDMSPFEGLSDMVRAWIEDTSGWWATEEIDRDLGLTSPNAKQSRKKVLQRLKASGVIEQHAKQNKQWRYVNTRVTSLEFKAAGRDGILPVRWPMGLENFVNLFPGNLAVVAGSPNAGKTALLLNFIRLNMQKFPVYYFCSEMGDVELRNRLEMFEGIGINEWSFQALERASDFADVMRPDAINIVDFLEMTEELYRVNSHLAAISHKVGSGLAIVAVQKKVGAAYGRGQEFGLEKPKLYLSMDRGKLQIIKGKSWAKKHVDPAGLACTFKITGGCKFEVTKQWFTSADH